MDKSSEMSPWKDMGDAASPAYNFRFGDNSSAAPEHDSVPVPVSGDSGSIVKPRQNSQTPEPSQAMEPKCDHWSDRSCALNASGSRQCCDCSDQRPDTESHLYSMYIDGQGWVEGATRTTQFTALEYAIDYTAAQSPGLQSLDRGGYENMVGLHHLCLKLDVH